MANQEHLDILKQGVEVWNRWRQEHSDILPDLSYADLSNTKLRGANLKMANLIEAYFNETDLMGVDLGGAILSGAHIRRANVSGADLSGAYLKGAYLINTNLRETRFIQTTLHDAKLSGCDLSFATLVATDFTNATLANCRIYGISVWNINLQEAQQENLIITPYGPSITVDNLKVAQFIFLLLNNQEIREVIDTIISKVVLILGRFTPGRKAVLDAIRDELHTRNYTPVLFDFEKLASRDITETVSTLAHMARFVIADITDAKSIPQELMRIVPNLPSVPVQPLILSSQQEYGMFEHFTRFPWVLPVYHYTDEMSLLQSLKEKVIAPAEQKARELSQSL